MKNSLDYDYAFTEIANITQLPFTQDELKNASVATNEYLKKLPVFFGTTVHGFYSTLNQRNLSGFIGEVFKHAIFAINNNLVPNPHPDGRPDVLVLSDNNLRNYFHSCFDGTTKAPIRDNFAPFKFGGIEIKCTIGNVTNACQFDIGQSRVSKVSGFTYWAHHAHACDLLGLYYDYCDKNDNSPQIKAITFSHILEEDWNKVSTGRPDRKKTSNTSLNKNGADKLRNSLLMYSDEEAYVNLLKRLKYIKSV